MNRNLSYKINKLLTMFPVVAIIGARQVGKTTLSKDLRPDWVYLDLEKPSDFDRLDRDPELFFQQNPDEVIIDEAQLSPKLFSVLRGVIDKVRTKPGRFIITGSSRPELLKNISESLAGRVATVELGTLKANEIVGVPLSPFYKILMEELSADLLSTLPEPKLTQVDIEQAWILGGYPEPCLNTLPGFYLQWMESYEKTYLYRDIATLYPKLNKVAYQRFLTMLCRLSGTILNKSEVARALEVSEKSVREYLTIADGTFLWRQLPSYEKAKVKSVIKMPKGHIRDSGLLHTLLRLTTKEQILRDPIVGRSFESFMIEEIIKGIQATELTHWTPYYYRTRSGAEIDLILEGPFGTLPIEIKYGIKTDTKVLRNLTQFIEEHDLSFGLLINQASNMEWLTKKIFQLPAWYL